MCLNYEFSLRYKSLQYPRDHFKLVFLMATHRLSKLAIFLDETFMQGLACIVEARHKGSDEQFKLKVQALDFGELKLDGF